MTYTPLARRYRHVRRYREIARILLKHGLGQVVELLGLAPYLSLPRRLLRREAAEELHLSAAQRMRLAIQELGPTFIKFGQILSTRPDLIPPDYLAQLVKLQDEVPPAPWELVREEIEGELGASLDDLFASFEPEPIAAASLGQVHSAMLRSGEEVVVKARRPGIEEVIKVDLEILHDLARLAQERTPLREMYDLTEIAEDFAFTLRNEMDYRREGRNADCFRHNFAGESYLYIPKVYWDYTTDSVLTLERIQGVKIDDIEALDAAGVDRHAVAENAARLIIKEVLEDGFFHADPHPGNFFVMPVLEGQREVIGAMDFGMVGHILQRDREDLLRLYVASVQLDTRGIVDQLMRMGAIGRRVNRAGLERDIWRLLTNYRGLPLGEIRAREVVEDVIPIAYRYRLQLPSRLWLLAKTLMMSEGVGLKLDPYFEMFAFSQPYVRRFLRQMASPQIWGRRLLKGAGDWAEFLSIFPQQAPRLLDQLEEGEMGFTLRLERGEQALARLDRLGNRLAVSILVAAFIISLALLIPTLSLTWPWGLMTWLIVAGFATVSFLGLWLLVSIWRSGQR